MKKIIVNNVPRLYLAANTDIAKGTEISYDYGDK
jgi:SET domain-containing protein